MSQSSPSIVAQRYGLPTIPSVQVWVEEVIHFATKGDGKNIPEYAIGELKRLSWRLGGFTSECKVNIETVLLRRRLQVLVNRIELICVGAVPPPNRKESRAIVKDVVDTYRSIVLHAYERVHREEERGR